ncbi:hypothetical protein [Sorangium cellulosum]|uniref:OmpA-like domain-containing protein n=1 Tax=Sorangium cellulosum So0157-2 TaxID=1254432 RepID=S4XMJ6_SORCE|nr:hypothetical protein [Sorangium cellulosum]AGP34402.1 hypothetical protein SCE1572_07715 [Sorangium cellulosum So0157-2]
MSARRLATVAVAGVVLAACAPIPRPAVLDELDHVRAGAAAAESKRYAPGAFARAEKLRGDALAALDEKDRAGAQILGEQAVAAHAHAHAISRVARAEAAEAEAKAQRSAGEASLAGLEAEQARVAAEVDALDMRIKVARDAQPVVPSGKADADREKARLAAARSLALQARLLCGAARLLTAPAPPGNPQPDGTQPSAALSDGAQPSAAQQPGAAQPGSASLAAQLDEATAAIKKLDADLAEAGVAGRAAPAPIDQASRARAGCLAALTAARRAATPVTRAPGAGDALLAELSAAGTWSPVRDDRGVVVTLRGLFAGNALTKTGEARLRDLSRVAAAHPAFPVAVVVHTDREISAREEPAWAARADAVVRALDPAQGASAAAAPQAPRIAPFLAGSAAPVVDPGGNERGRNARVEVVFVTPETL